MIENSEHEPCLTRAWQLLVGNLVTYSPARAIAELMAQHDMLRGMMDRCEELADELDAGHSGPLQLTREVARLRLAFEAHNKFEEQMLRPVLLTGVSAEALEKLIADHVDDHRAMRAQLTSTETAPLRAVIAAMRAHLEGEERHLLASRGVATASRAD